MEDFNKCISDLNDFNFILDKRKKYEEICSQILDLYVAIDSCNVDHDDPDSSCSCGTYAAKIAELEKQRLDLRNEIIGLLTEFVGIDVAELCPPADLSATSFDVWYLFDIDALIAIYSISGALKPTPPGYGLFDMYN